MIRVNSDGSNIENMKGKAAVEKKEEESYPELHSFDPDIFTRAAVNDFHPGKVY